LSTVAGKVVLAFLLMQLLCSWRSMAAWRNLLTGLNVPSFSIDFSGRRFKKSATGLGFIATLLESATSQSLEQNRIHVTDGGGYEANLGLLEALAAGDSRFAGFADEDGRYHTRWQQVAQKPANCSSGGGPAASRKM
jgi:hypothetical protein